MNYNPKAYWWIRMGKPSNTKKGTVKQALKDYKLAKGCARCGYNRCARALAYHHKEKGGKEYNMSQFARSWKIAEQELMKCIILCHNCHMELHAGLWEL